MAIGGLDESVSNFAIHPDFRQVASFALGWVMITSLSSIISSTLIQRLTGFIIRGRSSDAESYAGDEKSLDFEKTLDLRHGYSSTALFALPVCFLFASVANFGSLLAFAMNGDATCAFVVAWGGMAGQSGRLVGALIVIFELHKMGTARWEFWAAIVWLVIGIAFIFLNNAVATGILTPFAPLSVSYCDRKHFLPASLVSSLLYFSLEVYVIARVVLFLSVDRKMGSIIQDTRVLRPVSLLLLELLTLVPSAVPTNIVAEFVPFSIGAVAVLLAFAHSQPTLPAEASPHLSTLSYSSYATYPSVQRQETRRSVQSIHPPTPPPVPAPRRHPFSASALSDPTLQYSWNPPNSARSTRTIDTDAARSIHDAVVQVGRRVRAPSRDQDGSFMPQERQEGTPGVGNSIVPSQVAFAERLDQDRVQANSLSARPRPTVETPTRAFYEDDMLSDLVSHASRVPASNFRLSRLGEGPSRSRRTSYRTSFVPESPETEESAAPSVPLPVHDGSSRSSSERRQSTSFSASHESSAGHSRSNSNPTRRWPTFNGEQFRAAGYAQSNSGRSRASSGSTPSTVHRPPPILLPSLPSAGLRQSETPRGPRPPPLSAQSPRFS
ncbi:hypothetical protein FB45DRAFT_904066 [Roridomyces roridus]|uniref:Uncharacterized protein n=1 Tax=Roridomyces roridus TaxID=1738132 RepID=A0AAD7C4R0_9AGAR|nr:hypothetical protein FB45DRAFT_904066 [Roridomyces roridus]